MDSLNDVLNSDRHETNEVFGSSDCVLAWRYCVLAWRYCVLAWRWREVGLTTRLDWLFRSVRSSHPGSNALAFKCLSGQLEVFGVRAKCSLEFKLSAIDDDLK